MKMVKSPKTIYLKDSEKEELELIANIKNMERAKTGKKSLGIFAYIHLMLQLGIDAELKRLNLPIHGITPSEPNELLAIYQSEIEKSLNKKG